MLDSRGSADTVTGGKLTTFRVIAQDVLKAVREWLPDMAEQDDSQPVFDVIADQLPKSLPEQVRVRLNGRYGHDALPLVEAALPDELEPIPGTEALWAELRWAARAEGVVHLDDLLLRRVRLGLLLPQGGVQLHGRIRAICQDELGWDDATWVAEWDAYQQLWQQHYSLPNRETIPEWRLPPAAAWIKPAKRSSRSRIAALLSGLAAVLFFIYWTLRKPHPQS